MAKMRVPKTLGTCIDKMYEVRARRLELQREAEELKKDETALREAALDHMRRDRTTKATGKVATFSYRPEAVPVVEDWDAFYDWVSEEGAFECLQRRLNGGACMEYIEDEESNVRGLKVETVNKFSLTKAGG